MFQSSSASSHCTGSSSRANWESHNRNGTRNRHIASGCTGSADTPVQKAETLKEARLTDLSCDLGCWCEFTGDGNRRTVFLFGWNPPLEIPGTFRRSWFPHGANHGDGPEGCQTRSRTLRTDRATEFCPVIEWEFHFVICLRDESGQSAITNSADNRASCRVSKKQIAGRHIS